MTVATQPPVGPSPAPTEAASDAGPRTWLRRIVSGGQIVESCPSWCTDSHATDGRGCLEDLSHGSYFAGPELPVFDAEDGTLAVPVFAGRINVDPYSSDPKRNTPHLHLEPFPDEVMECLTPTEFAAVIARVRAHCDRMDEVLAELVRARSEHGNPVASGAAEVPCPS
jgi:hypothetical protein